MPLTNVHSRWSGGDLIFHEADNLGAIANILTIGDDAVTVGSTTNDIDFKWYGAGSVSFILDVGDSSMTLVGCNVSVDGDLEIGTDDIALDQGYYIYFDGLTGGESIRSDTEHYLVINATNGIDLNIGGTDEINITSTAVTLPTNNLTLTAGSISVAEDSFIYFEGQGSTTYLLAADPGVLTIEAATSINFGADLFTDRWGADGRNTFIGLSVCSGGGVTGAGIHNSAYGYGAAAALTTGAGNVAVGSGSLALINTGDGNIAIGYQAGNNITSGDYNIVIGYDIDAPSATVAGGLQIGRNANGQGRILGDNGGDMEMNALDAHSAILAVADTAVVTCTSSAITLAQDTTCTSATGATSATSAALVSYGGISCVENIFVGGAVAISTTLLVAGTITGNGNAGFGGALTVGGTVTGNGNAVFGGGLNVGGTSHFAGDLTTGGALGVGNTLIVNNNVTLGANLSVAQGNIIYLDGQGGGEYIRSDTEDYILIRASTGVDFGIGGNDVVNITNSAVSFEQNPVPGTTNSQTLGTSSLRWGDLFLGDASVIDFNNDVTITHSANLLTVASGGLNVGATGAGRETSTYDGVKQLAVYTTCASTDTGTTWEPQRFDNVATGEGQIGCRFRVNLFTNVRLGGYANAFKAQVECDTDGGSTGLLSTGCFEMVFPKGNTVGAFSCIELEATTPGSGYTGAASLDSYIFCNCTGNQVSGFQDNGVLFHFDIGNAAGTGNLVGTGFSTVRCAFGQAFSHTLMYIPLSTVEETFTSAYPVVLTYGGTALDITSTITVADIVQSITVNDSGTQAGSGRGIGLFVDYVMTNDKTSTYGVRSSRINTNIGGNVDSVICGDWYIHAIDNKTIGWLMGLSMYWENYGSAIGNLAMLDLGMNSANTTVGRHTFIRCREHTGIVNNSSIIRCEGSSAAEYFLWLDTGASGACEMVEAASHQSSATDLKLKIYIEGVGDRYIELVPA